MNKFVILAFFAVVACATAATINVIDIYSKSVFNVAVLRNRKPVIVYLSNAKCQKRACEWVGPQLERIAKNKSEKLYLAKVNTDKIPSLIEQLGVQQYPTVMAFKDGEMVEMIEGGKWGQIVNLVNKASKW